MMCRKFILICSCIFLLASAAVAQQKDAHTRLSGKVVNEKGEPLSSATVRVKEAEKACRTNHEGFFSFKDISEGRKHIIVGMVGFAEEKIVVNVNGNTDNIKIVLKENEHDLRDIEVFGVRNIMPEKLNLITRMPLKPSEQIQSISVISEKLLQEQGALTITDAARNVPGVTLFGSYGNVRESMSIRGYRGVPVVKNGVRIDSDFRTGSAMVDMQGVESIQVIKGATAITQGLGNDIGSPGGIINIVTKTPKFYNGGEVSLRAGSWGQVRPTFDVQAVLDRRSTIAIRLNGAFERSDSYRKNVSKNRFYFNPSMEWRPGKNTVINVEMDYLSDATTPDRGTVNMASDSVFALHPLPYNQFLGFKTDKALTNNLTYIARIEQRLSKKLSARAAFLKSSLNLDQTGVGALALLKGSTDYNIRSRSLTRWLREDDNAVLQFDFVGKDVYTGKIKHTFQIGFDYKWNDLSTTAYGSVNVDTINLSQNFSNILPATVVQKGLTAAAPVHSNSYSYGLMAQEVMTINEYIKAIMGIRYSYGDSKSATSTGSSADDAWNPMLGIMISPWKNVNFFGSYTTTTNLRSAGNIQLDRVTPVGASLSKQWEFGVKSDWLNNKLRFNLTGFYIFNSNLSYTEYDASGTATGYYGLAGDLNRRGIETELVGRILSNLQVIVGYAYLDAQYKNSPAYMDGTAPSNAPKHTGNAWAQYLVNKGALSGLSIGAGVYYVGERPTNEYTKKVIIHNTQPGVKPFDMPAYTTLNAQLGYTKGRTGIRVFCNNILDAIGYNSYYRGGYINQTDPRNFAAVLTYKF